MSNRASKWLYLVMMFGPVLLLIILPSLYIMFSTPAEARPAAPSARTVPLFIAASDGTGVNHGFVFVSTLDQRRIMACFSAEWPIPEELTCLLSMEEFYEGTTVLRLQAAKVKWIAPPRDM